MEKNFDFSRVTRSAETPDIPREREPQLRPQAEIERNPPTVRGGRNKRATQPGQALCSRGGWIDRGDI